MCMYKANAFYHQRLISSSTWSIFKVKDNLFDLCFIGKLHSFGQTTHWVFLGKYCRSGWNLMVESCTHNV